MKVLIINQYYPPDRAATAILLGQLVEDLAKHHKVTVICGMPTYAPEEQSPSTPSLEKIIRIPLFKVSRANFLIRLFNYLLYLLGAGIRAITLPRFDVVICWTDPPIIGLLGALLKHLKSSKFIFVSQDVYPEVAQAVGKMNNFASIWLLQRISQIILKSSAVVIAVGRDMKEKLLKKGVPIDRIQVIPNWQDLDHLKPSSGLGFREVQRIDPDLFVVMHSGNIGLSQDFDTLLKTAHLIRDQKNILFMLIGDGARKNNVLQKIEELNLTNVRWVPYQPKSTLDQSLSAGNLHYVSLLPPLTGYIVPSKVYGILAVGRPILANVSPESEIAHVVRDSKSGVISKPDPKNLSQLILDLSQNPARIEEMGKRGRTWVEMQGGRKKAISSYLSLIKSL